MSLAGLVWLVDMYFRYWLVGLLRCLVIGLMLGYVIGGGVCVGVGCCGYDFSGFAWDVCVFVGVGVCCGCL